MVHEKLKGTQDEDFVENFLKKYHEKTIIPQEVGTINIFASFDMSWQKKGTEHNYDGNSDRAYLIGYRTKMIEKN